MTTVAVEPTTLFNCLRDNFVRVVADQWVDLAFTFDLLRKEIGVFFNGTRARTIKLPSDFILHVINSLYHEGEKQVAFTSYCPGVGFLGLADQLSIYNRVLTDAGVRRYTSRGLK